AGVRTNKVRPVLGSPSRSAYDTSSAQPPHDSRSAQATAWIDRASAPPRLPVRLSTRRKDAGSVRRTSRSDRTASFPPAAGVRLAPGELHLVDRPVVPDLRRRVGAPILQL